MFYEEVKKVSQFIDTVHCLFLLTLKILYSELFDCWGPINFTDSFRIFHFSFRALAINCTTSSFLNWIFYYTLYRPKSIAMDEGLNLPISYFPIFRVRKILMVHQFTKFGTQQYFVYFQDRASSLIGFAVFSDPLPFWVQLWRHLISITEIFFRVSVLHDQSPSQKSRAKSQSWKIRS